MWLMALCLPVQGLVVAFAMPCPPSHHGSTAPVAASEPVAGSAALDAHPSTHPAHGSAHRHAHDPAPAVAPDQPDDAHHHAAGSAGHDMLKCCSAAMSMAAVMPVTLIARTPARSPVPRSPAADHYRDAALDGPERPPKPFLA